MRRKLTVLILGLIYSFFAYADTFVVTSNADSGPGSLREAITMANANGTATKDYIHFNIADISIDGRTIFIQTDFPALTSNLEIDGTSQAGNKIGVSDAKVRITHPSGSGLLYVFTIIDQKNISIFGLHFDNIQVNQNMLYYPVCIALKNAENINIGAAGRGNYFTNTPVVISEVSSSVPGKGMVNGLFIRSNILNLSEDGNKLISNALLLTLNNVKNLEIGGEQEAEGNYLSSDREHILWTYTDTFAHVNTGIYRIQNNKLGCNYDQTIALKCGSIYLRNGNNYGYTDTTQIIIKNNSYNAALLTGSNTLQNFIRLENKNGFIDIKGNKIGLLAMNMQYYSSINMAFTIVGCENGIIGGDNPEDKNIISGCNTSAIGMGNNKAISITKNSIFCNYAGLKISSAKLPVPKTLIFKIDDFYVEGKTLPDSKVEVFLTKKCAKCDNGEVFLGYTMSDATGAWSFTSNILLDGAVTATTTSPLGVTGEFAKPEYKFENFVYSSPTCNANNGFIKGIKFFAGTKFYWVRTHAGRKDTLYVEDINDAGPGYYKFVVEQGKFCYTSYDVDLNDNSPKITSLYKTIVQPSCGLSNGKIFNHAIRGSYNKIFWKDKAGNISAKTVDLYNVGAGEYKLIILDTIHGCGDSTQFYTLTNQTGPSLQTDNIQITSAICNNNNGSIKGIIANNTQGSVSIRWVDSLNNIVGNSFDLLNIYPGKYRLKFKDSGGCDTIITQYFIVGNAGTINIDTINRVITASKCSGNTGSITNIKITGGDTFEWKNIALNTVVSTSIEVYNLSAGQYRLTVKNSFGCVNTSAVFTVPQSSFKPIIVSGMDSKASYCGQPNGYTNVTSFNIDPADYSFRWIDSATHQTVAASPSLQNSFGGTFHLWATDINGCEKQIHTAVIPVSPMPYFDYSNMQVSPDNCLSGKGSINNIVVKDMSGGSGRYIWMNENNDSIGNTINIRNLSPGNYRIKAIDLMNCVVSSQPVTITNRNMTLTYPQFTHPVILKNTTATLTVQNRQQGIYQLFDDAGTTNLIEQNNSGFFTTPILSFDHVYYVRFVQGVCVSDVAPVNVTVVDKTAIYIPSAFTPNADGKNDLLKVTGFGKIKLMNFTIYNRWGQVVFSTTNIMNGWNGMQNGKPLDTGAYVWVVKANDEHTGKFIEEKGTVILLR